MEISEVPSVKAARERERQSNEQHAARATILWQNLDKNAKTGIRFGLFPAKEMATVEKEGYDAHKICVALMDCASKDGGMRA